VRGWSWRRCHSWCAAARPRSRSTRQDENDAALGADADAEPAEAGAADVAVDADGPASFFIAGELAGMTWVATHNITPSPGNWIFLEAWVEPTTEFPQWYFNIHLPDAPYPFTVQCDENYIELRETGLNVGSRKYVSRSSTGTCSITFVQPAVPGTLEGTFTANLRLSGTMMDFAVTNGRFRLPAGP
jgi:hypothetical protein